jgi:peptidoglycan hydrolase CwlO-like protein
MLVYILIVLFLILISYQISLAYFDEKNGMMVNDLIEGMDNATSTTVEYKPYNLNDPNNALILAQQNAGNIDYLKGRVEELTGIKKKVDDMQQNIDSMQTQIDSLVQQQADAAQQLVGNTPPTITGTEAETTANVESSIG